MGFIRRPLLTPASIAAVAISLMMLIGNGARAQPPRIIRIVVPFPPGGGADILARLLADQFRHVRNQSVVIENRPGAGTTIATEAASRAPADGSTILIVANSFLINRALKQLTYDPLTSFEPLCLLTRSPNVISVNSGSPYQSLSDLLEEARAKPGSLTLAFQGPGTSQHIGAETLKRAAKVQMINVPFTGAAPALNALLGGHVTALFVNYPSVAEQAKAGKVRILATGSPTRPRSIPNVPTVAEAIHAPFEEDVWFGAVVPANTPTDVVTDLDAWFREATLDAAVSSKMAAQGFEPAGVCGADFANYLRQQTVKYGRIITDANLKLE